MSGRWCRCESDHFSNKIPYQDILGIRRYSWDRWYRGQFKATRKLESSSRSCNHGWRSGIYVWVSFLWSYTRSFWTILDHQTVKNSLEGIVRNQTRKNMTIMIFLKLTNLESIQTDLIESGIDQTDQIKIHPGKHLQWLIILILVSLSIILFYTRLKYLDTVGRPPRVLLYRVNKTIGKWFQNFLPKSCKKQPKIERRLKGLKKKINNIMPEHEFIYTWISKIFVSVNKWTSN